MGTGNALLVCLSVVCSTSLRPDYARAADGGSGMPARAVTHPGPVRIEDRLTASAVRNALDGATRRLQGARCQEVFADFSDQGGRSLGENLRALGETGGSYIANRMLFYDGGDQGRCRRRTVMAYTQPGSRVVLVCGRAFQAAYWDQPRLAEAIVIHETLHSLGLGENPPSSGEITSRVLKKCR